MKLVIVGSPLCSVYMLVCGTVCDWCVFVSFVVGAFLGSLPGFCCPDPKWKISPAVTCCWRHVSRAARGSCSQHEYCPRPCRCPVCPAVDHLPSVWEFSGGHRAALTVLQVCARCPLHARCCKLCSLWEHAMQTREAPQS